MGVPLWRTGVPSYVRLRQFAAVLATKVSVDKARTKARADSKTKDDITPLSVRKSRRHDAILNLATLGAASPLGVEGCYSQQHVKEMCGR
jgi:hypothetical protein